MDSTETPRPSPDGPVPPALGSFADWQLSKPATPRSSVLDLVRRATGAEVDRVERIVQGYSNEIYRAWCADGQDVVVRILRFDDDVSSAVSAGEARAIERVRTAGVPAPEVMLLDRVRVDGAWFPVMLQRTVPGRPLGEVLDQLSETERNAVLTSLGGLMASINGVTVDATEDWVAAAAAQLAGLRARDDVVSYGRRIGVDVEQALELAGRHLQDADPDAVVLCHGDLSAKHVFVEHEDERIRVSGIIDFGDWQPGPAVHDLAVLRVRSPEVELAPLLRGYGRASDATFRRELDRHTLLIALEALAFGVTEGDEPGIATTAHLARDLLSRLTP